MKIVCTGGTGFIGARLIPALVTQGHSVIRLSRGLANTKTPEHSAGSSSGVRDILWNGRDAGPWVHEIDGADAVLNFAGESLDRKRWTQPQKTRILDSRVHATRAIVSAMQTATRKPGVLISASGVGYYGQTGETPVTEQSPPGEDFLAATCRQWEAEARSAEALGVRTVILRQGLVLGQGGGAFPRMILPFKLFAGGPLGSGDQWFPWIHRDDLVSIVVEALHNPHFSGPTNVAAPEAVTNKEFCRTLGRVLARPCWFPVPAPFLRLLFGEMSSMILTGQRVVPERLKELGFSFRFPNLEGALRDIQS